MDGHLDDGFVEVHLGTLDSYAEGPHDILDNFEKMEQDDLEDHLVDTDDFVDDLVVMDVS